MIFLFFNLQNTVSLSHKSHKGYRLLIYMVPQGSPVWTSAIYSKHESLHKNNFSCAHCRCVFKDEIDEQLPKFVKKQPGEVTHPPTHTHTHTFLSICSWPDEGETRRICVMCRWAVVARPWFKGKQSFTSITSHAPHLTASLLGSDQIKTRKSSVSFRAKVAGCWRRHWLGWGREAGFSFSVVVLKTETNPNYRSTVKDRMTKRHALKRAKWPQLLKKKQESRATTTRACRADDYKDVDSFAGTDLMQRSLTETYW